MSDVVKVLFRHAMFATIAHASDSVRVTLGRPEAMNEMLSMVCTRDYDVPCKEASPSAKAPQSNTVRMYNKLMCGKSYCGGGTDAKLDKMIKN